MLFNQTAMIFEIVMFMIIIIIIFKTNFFTFLDKNEQGRETNIDGLRAFLSLGVVFHHMIFSYHAVYGEKWSIGNYAINGQFGGVAVILFFILSAYVLTQKSIYNSEQFIKFYINRFFRIAPMAWVSSFLCLITTIIFGGGVFYGGLLNNLFYWFDAGLSYTMMPDINNFKDAYLINAGVMWTLPWEWFLYFSLPIFMILRRKINNFAISQFLIFLSVYFISTVAYREACYILCFALGMMARDIKDFIKITKLTNSIIILSCLLFIFFRDADPYSLSNIFIEFILFICVCIGGDLFGLLRNKGVVRIGEISYSIYLLHGIFWFYMNNVFTNSYFSCIEYFFMSLLFFILMCITSSLTFVFVERKGIKLGRCVYSKYIVSS